MAKLIKSVVLQRKTEIDFSPIPFRVDSIKVEHHLDNEKKIEKPYISFERGDAVAALIVNQDTGMVTLVDQFRAPTVDHGVPSGRLLEIAAGVIKQNETPLQCLKREVFEETGYVLEFNERGDSLKGVELIAEVFPSPGGCSERIFVYCVEVDSKTQRVPTQGMESEGEFIDQQMVPMREFLQLLDGNGLRDAKTVLAGHWLKNRLHNQPLNWRRKCMPGDKEEFLVAKGDGRPDETGDCAVGYYCGDIGKVGGVDVWVNSENRNFQMDQFGGRSLSARIRTLGAHFDDNDNLIEDTIQDAIRGRLAIGAGVECGQVIDTTSGRLADAPWRVGRIIHASVVSFEVSPDGVRRPVSTLQIANACVENALRLFERLPTSLLKTYSTILVPLLGTGQSGVDREAAITSFIEIAIKHFTSNPAKRLKRFYLLAYSSAEIEMCDRVMSRHPALTRIRKEKPDEPRGTP